MENEDKFAIYLENQISAAKSGLASAQTRMKEYQDLVDLQNVRIDVLQAAQFAYQNARKQHDDSNREKSTR